MKILKPYQIFLIFSLLIFTFILYSPMLNTKLALVDDHVMLKINEKNLPDISFKQIVTIFKSHNRGLYHPLVTISYSLEKTLFGFVPEIFHFDNIIFHILNIILVFIIFLKLSDSFWLSFIISALFAIHPTRTEVVCWISARKDLLYALFYLLSIFSYIKTYEKKNSIFWIILSIFCYLCSCLSKSMAITLPFIIILIDLYTKHFDKQKFKTYFFYILITFIFVLATIEIHYFTDYDFTQETDINSIFNSFNLAINFINAHFNILFYLDKLLLPIKLYLIYPFFYNKYSSMPPFYILYSPLVLYILLYCCYLSLKKTKVFFYGFLFFLISILPVSGIFPIGDFVVANRYTYISYLGLFFISAKLMLYIYNNIATKFKPKIFNFIKISIIVIYLTVFGILYYISLNKVFDWQTNKYYAPFDMKYYEFGIRKDVRTYYFRKIKDKIIK